MKSIRVLCLALLSIPFCCQVGYSSDFCAYLKGDLHKLKERLSLKKHIKHERISEPNNIHDLYSTYFFSYKGADFLVEYTLYKIEDFKRKMALENPIGYQKWFIEPVASLYNDDLYIRITFDDGTVIGLLDKNTDFDLEDGVIITETDKLFLAESPRVRPELYRAYANAVHVGLKGYASEKITDKINSIK